MVNKTQEMVPSGILPDVSIERAIQTLKDQGHWPTRGDWPIEEAECDAYLLRAFAGRPTSELLAYLG